MNKGKRFEIVIPTQTLYYPESNNRAKFIREESLRSDEDALDCIELVDMFAK
jgi:hypothetical protein